MSHNALYAPIIALVLWSFVMWAWMYATRLPEIFSGRATYDPNRPDPATAFNEQIPPRVRWKADNYNHLMEQPTLFYAVALTIAAVQPADALSVGLAWAYVGLRVIHSLVQAIANEVKVRFLVFVAGSLVLFAMTLRAAALVF